MDRLGYLWEQSGVRLESARLRYVKDHRSEREEIGGEGQDGAAPLKSPRVSRAINAGKRRSVLSRKSTQKTTKATKGYDRPNGTE